MDGTNSRNRRGDDLGVWLAAVVDSSDDAIVTKTLDGVIRSWNRGAERLFGYTAEEAIGQRIFLIIPDDRVAEEEDVLARDISKRVRLREVLQRAHDELEALVQQRTAQLQDEMDRRQRIEHERVELLTRLVVAQEDERRHLARELHDQLGQSS